MSKPSKVLVTGGAGFIGSHCCKALRAAGFDPVVYDNLSMGHRENVKWGELHQGDLLDSNALAAALATVKPIAVIHLAASAYVGESVINPAKYYRNNVAGMESLLNACQAQGVSNFIFSSSCATYGIPKTDLINEATEQRPINPYGRTKLIGEHMLEDFASAYGLKFAILRYFNACGADLDGEIGEWHDPETHLIPRVLMAASGKIPEIEIFGDDFPTPDGTCIRDYVHVVDLANAHVRALQHLLGQSPNIKVNLGTGRGHSIREILAAVERFSGRPVPAVFKPRREGDPPRLVADVTLAKSQLGFNPQYSDMETIIRTAAPFFGLKVQG
jgi:UDP-arabinose 4-epimerase